MKEKKESTTLNELAYAIVITIVKKRHTKRENRNKTTNKHSAWKQKNQKEIEAFRGELSVLEELSKKLSNVKTRK